MNVGDGDEESFFNEFQNKEKEHIQKVKIVNTPPLFLPQCTFTMFRPRVTAQVNGKTVTLIEVSALLSTKSLCFVSTPL